jgi:hypothetical protein
VITELMAVKADILGKAQTKASDNPGKAEIGGGV